MAYEELVGRLAAPPPVLSVAAFPDGSVDSYYRVRDGDRRLATREAFVEAVVEGRSALELADRRRMPGGQTVNMGLQAAALRDTVRHAGYLDDPIFESLPFETTSMGEPAEVAVLEFESEDLMLAARPPDTREWRIEQLRETVDLPAFLDADLLCCGNAGVFHDLERVADVVAAASEDVQSAGPGHDEGTRGVLVFDPGEISGLTAESRRRLVEALATFQAGRETVLSANDAEIRAIASAIPAGGSGDALARLTERIRDHSGITGVVAHTDRRAVAATADGVLEVPNLNTERVVTVTGAGDRFTAGLGHGLAAGWPWNDALQLGNACASYHVVHGETVQREEIAEYVEQLETS